jgi:hypothetical protein
MRILALGREDRLAQSVRIVVRLLFDLSQKQSNVHRFVVNLNGGFVVDHDIAAKVFVDELPPSSIEAAA